MKKYYEVVGMDASGENGSTWYVGTDWKMALKEWYEMKQHQLAQNKVGTGTLTSSTCEDEEIRFTSDDASANIIYTFNW